MPKPGDVFSRQLSFGRHFGLIEVSDGPDQETLVRFSWHNSGPRVTPFRQCVVRRESETAFLFLLTVTSKAPFNQQRPNLFFKELNIGSRPSSRKASDRIEDLRAIPWVFSWGLNRAMLPGWLGFGSAVKKFLEREGQPGLEQLQIMYKKWPFFRGLMSNMDMVLSKTDMGIASSYAELVKDVELRERIFGAIEREWEDTVKMLFKVTGNTSLLQDNPMFARSLMTRTPYIDPLNHLQVSLLDRHRAGDDSELVKRAIHLGINGIATGLRNSG